MALHMGSSCFRGGKEEESAMNAGSVLLTAGIHMSKKNGMHPSACMQTHADQNLLLYELSLV